MRLAATTIRALICAATCALTLATVALAEDAGAPPPQCTAQVDNALAQLEPAFASSKRKVQVNDPGSIESVIRAYVPTKFHTVVEGVFKPAKPQGSCPPDMALSGGGRFCIDKYEASVVEEFPDGTTKPHPYWEPLSSTHAYVAKSVAGVFPQAYASAVEGLAACTNAGKRMCEPVEWRAACGGPNGYAYPYGPTRVAGKCKDAGKAPMLLYYASSLSKGFDGNQLNDPRLIQVADTVAKTGSMPDCVTDEGVFDMVGNMDEWTGDPNGTFQGGYWLDTSLHGEGCAYRTVAHDFAYHDYSLGFRCCADPK